MQAAIIYKSKVEVAAELFKGDKRNASKDKRR